MPGLMQRGRKRPSATLSEDEEQSSLSNPVSTRGKRARYAPDASEEVSDKETSANGFRAQNGHRDYDGEAEDEYIEEAHQPGSIVRVTLKNFVTYTAAEFNPGPSLNMVIGPNGTGKSTLVCAICLGLGWDPNNLGRSKDIGEFVKHGTAEAMIEIELAAGKSQRVNPVIRRDIMKANSKSKFLINGERATQKQVTQLAKTFSIQIDNLCQFLPQDRVVEFARLSPVALLAETQRAAAPEEMVEWHNQLKGLRTEQKRLEEGKTAEEGHLKQQQSKQSAAREDVERWNQRQRLVMRSDVLDKCRPVIESRVLKTQFNQVTADAEAAKSELDQLNAEVAPAQQALTDMELYRDQIHVVKEQRRVHVKKAQELADKLVGQIKVQKDALTDNENRVAAEKEEEKKRKQDTIRIQNKIAKFDRDISEAPVAIDETASKTRLSDIRSRVHEIETSDVELTDKMRGIVARSHDLQKEKAELMAQRKDLDTQSGQQASLLKNTSADTAEAWAWFQENRDSLHLQGDVFGPPILTCTVKDPRFADAVEGQLRGVTDVTAITCTNGVDIQVLSNKFFATQDAGGLGLHSITIRTVTQPLSNFKHPVSDDQLREYGFHSWILEHIDGPEPVLAMLCDSAQLHRAAYTPNQLTNAQHRAVEDTAMIMQWIAGREKFRISRRKEYGAVSTSVNALRKAQYFTKDQPSDAGKKRELENTITRVKREAEELKEQHSILREAQKELKNEHDQLESENRNLQADIQQKRKAKAAWDALPDKKREAEEELVSIQAKRKDTVSRILRIQASSEEAVLKVASLAVEYAKAVSRLRQVHETLVEAEIRFVEANSEIDSLKAENRDILEKVNAQTERVNALRERKKTLRKQYNNITKLAQRHINELNDEENEIMTEYQAFTTIEDLNNEAEALRNRLGLLADGNPDAVKAYEVREREIEQILEKIRKAEERLVEVAEQIGEIRAQWEPQLDALVAKISDGFSHNFAKIGCAGEVRVYKDEDFDKWSIQISVRFREGENLSVLDSQRQSGGERAVSTIFYLMALQDMARSPFRVVDEINQGMDPRNERMVHERMVDIACRERTSQYFLITPKLLSDLKFHPKMKIHCIASGEYMPGDYKTLDFQKLADIAIRKKMSSVGA